MTLRDRFGGALRRASGATRALRSRNYRLYFAGQLVSLTGTWMQRVAIGWLVYRLSGSGVWLGACELAGTFTSSLLAPLGGAVADRSDKRKILLCTQTGALIQSGILAALVLSGAETLDRLLLLSLLAGLIHGFDFPARHALAVELVDHREDLTSAIALNSFMFNTARILGPAAGGLVIARYGEGPCFLYNSLSYLAILASLLAIRTRPRPPREGRDGVLAGIAEGFAYLRGNAAIRPILGMVAIVSFMGIPYLSLLPMIVREVFHGDATTLGHLTATAGIGAVCGAAFIASRQRVSGLETRIPLAAIAFGGALILFSRTKSLLLATPLVALCGFEQVSMMVASNTLLQTVVDDAKRGRVMSFYTMTFLGGAPLGSLLLGSLSERFGTRAAFTFGGACVIAGGLLFLRRLPELRAASRAAVALADRPSGE